MRKEKKTLSVEVCEKIVRTLKERFEEHRVRHEGIEWEDVRRKLEADKEKLWVLCEMEATGGEPDVVAYDDEADAYLFMDCSSESPTGRRNVCYDREALEKRKENKPENNALDMARAMGIEILTEEQYRTLQQVGTFDTKTSSWVRTPDKIRSLGGAIFCDRRYDTVFVYHNSAGSYYGARGFRGLLKV